MSTSFRALIVKFGAIGNVVMAIPAVYALHQQVDWGCGQAVAPLLACYPWIQTIVSDDRALLTGSKPAHFKALSSQWRTLAGRQYKLCAPLSDGWQLTLIRISL